MFGSIVGSLYLVGTLIQGSSCATPCSDLDLVFDHSVVTLTYKIFVYMSEAVTCRKLVLDGYIGRDVDV